MASGGKKSGGKKNRGGAKPTAPMTAAAKVAAASPTAGMSGAQRIVWYSLHALVILVPLAMSNFNWIATIMPGLASTFSVPFTYDQFDIVKVFTMRACVLVGLGAWTFDFFLHGGKLRRTKADWLILALLAWILLTTFTSIHPATAFFGKYRRFEGWLSFATYAAAFFLVIQVIDRPSRIRSLARSLLLSGGLVSFYGLLQVIGRDPINWGTVLPFEFNRAFATYGNPDLLGGYLVFPLVLAPALALSEKRTGWRITYWVIFLITTVTWITSFVRGAWIGGAVGLAIVIFAVWRARPQFEVPDYAAAGVTALTAAGVMVWSSTNDNPVLNFVTRLKSIFEFGQGSALTRFEIWEAAWNAIKARPLLGFGADTFRLVFPKYKPLAYTKDGGYISVADNVHNYPLQMGSAIGIPGMLLLYATFGWILFLAAPNAFAKGKGSDRLVVTGFWAAAVAYLVSLTTGLSVTGCTIFLWVSFAVVLAPLATTMEVKPKAWGAAVGVVCLALSAALFVGNVVYIVADNYYLRGQFGIVANGRTPVDEIKTAISLNPYNDMYRAQLGQAHMDNMNAWLKQASDLQSKGQDPSTAAQQAQAEFRNAEAAYKDVIAFVPTEYDNYVFISALYNQAAQYFDPKYYEQAIKYSKLGQDAEPFGPLIRFQEAVALYGLGRYDEAQKVLEVASKQDPAFAEPRLMLADLYERKGRFREAMAEYTGVLEAHPDNATAKQRLEALEASGTSSTAPPTGTVPATATP